MIQAICLIIAVNILWQVGGQCWKPARRYIIPVLASIYSLFVKDRGKRWACGIILALMAVLSLGYGEGSDIRKLFGGSDTITRIAIAVLIAAVLVTYGIVAHGFLWSHPVILAVNIVAWQVRCGSVRIWKYDLLGEDACRATALAVSIIVV